MCHVLQVESFEDLQKDIGIAIHKPFYCSLHPGESVKFFCIGCQVITALPVDFCFGNLYPFVIHNEALMHCFMSNLITSID